MPFFNQPQPFSLAFGRPSETHIFSLSRSRSRSRSLGPNDRPLLQFANSSAIAHAEKFYSISQRLRYAIRASGTSIQLMMAPMTFVLASKVGQSLSYPQISFDYCVNFYPQTDSEWISRL